MDFVISKDGTKIAYELTGKGEVLIFITGAICHRKFKPIQDDVRTFEKSFQVCNYDRRGRGDSTDHPNYSLNKELDDLEALIDKLGGKARLYGHSSGCILALEATLRFPQKVSRLVIYDPSYAMTSDEQVKWDQLRDEIRGMVSRKEYAKALRAFLFDIGMPKIFVYLLPLMPGWKSMKSLAPTLLYDMELTRSLPPLDRLSGIKVPTIISYGEKSPESIKSVSRVIGGAMPQAKVIEVPGEDHMIKASKMILILIQA